MLRDAGKDIDRSKVLFICHAFFLRLQLPPKAYIHARTHFREKGGIFAMGGATSRNQVKGVIFQANVKKW